MAEPDSDARPVDQKQVCPTLILMLKPYKLNVSLPGMSMRSVIWVALVTIHGCAAGMPRITALPASELRPQLRVAPASDCTTQFNHNQLKRLER